jgi:hypothetical protein
MTIHRLTVTVTITETTTISITHRGEKTDEEALEPDTRPVAERTGRRGLRRSAGPAPGTTHEAGPGRD